MIASVANKLLSPTSYDTEVVLGRLGRIMVSSLVIEDIGHRVTQELVAVLDLTQAAIVLTNDQSPEILAEVGQVSPRLKTASSALVQASGGHFLDYRAAALEQQQLLDQLELTFVLPLVVQQKAVGLLALGKKRNGEAMSNQDIQLLEIFGSELTVALQNAQSYRQISEFNERLKREVEDATTQLKAAAEEVYKKNLQLHQLDKLKDEFISITSHELRTPLTAIRGYLWMAMHGKKKGQNFDQYMDRAYSSTERLITIVNDTLDISRIESGRVQLSPEPTSLVGLADEVASELAPKASEHAQAVTIDHPTGLPAADCDPNKIHQVLINIVGNALKFTPDQGKINVSFRQEGGQVITIVSDTGPGIGQEDQAKLFQKFSRLEATATIQGTGLGLYLCKQIIELSGGKIWIESQPGQGAKFLFSLPSSAQQPSILPARSHQFNALSLATPEGV